MAGELIAKYMDYNSRLTTVKGLICVIMAL